MIVMRLKEDYKKFALTTLIIVAVIIGFAVALRGISGTNLPIAAVQSGSMEPNIPTGSLLFIQKVNPEDIVAGPAPEGDVLIFMIYPPSSQKIYDYFFFSSYDPLPWSHRAINKAEINGTYYFLTKGDANAFPDQNPNLPTTWVSEDRVIGRVVYSVPYLGYPFLWFKNIYIVFAAIIILLILILIPGSPDKKVTKSEESTV